MESLDLFSQVENDVSITGDKELGSKWKFKRFFVFAPLFSLFICTFVAKI